MYRKQDAAVLDTAFVALCLILWNAQADQSADQTANRAAYTKSCERPHDRAGRNKRTHARYRQSADACEQAQCSPYGPADPYAGSSSFGRLCVLFGCKVLRPLVIRHKNRDIIV